MIGIFDDQILFPEQFACPSGNGAQVDTAEFFQFRLDSVANPFGNIVGVDFFLIRILEDVAAVGSRILPDDAKHFINRLIEVIFHGNSCKALIDGSLALNIIVQLFDHFQTLLFELFLARHAKQKAFAVGLRDDGFHGPDQMGFTGCVLDSLLQVKKFIGVQQFLIVLAEPFYFFLRPENIFVAFSDELFTGEPCQLRETPVAHEIPELVIGILDEHVTGEVIHDSLEQIRIILKTPFIFFGFRDVLNDPVVFLSVIFRFGGGLDDAHFIVAPSRFPVGTVETVHGIGFSGKQFPEFPVVGRKVFRIKPFFRRNRLSVTIHPVFLEVSHRNQTACSVTAEINDIRHFRGIAENCILPAEDGALFIIVRHVAEEEHRTGNAVFLFPDRGCAGCDVVAFPVA